MLSKHVDGRRRVAGTACDRAPSHESGSMINFLLMDKKSLGSEMSMAIREK
jgi:hypothetical protein